MSVKALDRLADKTMKWIVKKVMVYFRTWRT